MTGSGDTRLERECRRLKLSRQEAALLRIAPLVRRYLAALEVGQGRGPKYVMAHARLSEALQGYGSALEIDGYRWWYSRANADIVREPIRRVWHRQDGTVSDTPTPARCRVYRDRLVDRAERARLVEID